MVSAGALGLSAAPVGAQPLSDLPTAVLLPELAWSGGSEAPVAAADDPWIAPAARAGFATTPS